MVMRQFGLEWRGTMKANYTARGLKWGFETRNLNRLKRAMPALHNLLCAVASLREPNCLNRCRPSFSQISQAASTTFADSRPGIRLFGKKGLTQRRKEKEKICRGGMACLPTRSPREECRRR